MYHVTSDIDFFSLTRTCSHSSEKIIFNNFHQMKKEIIKFTAHNFSEFLSSKTLFRLACDDCDLQSIKKIINDFFFVIHER